LAPTDIGVLAVTVHVGDVPEHAPDHPAKTQPAAGAAVNVTELAVVKGAEHDDMQSIPEGLLVTRPLPLIPTVSACVPTS
jgi:hypothetical protein